MLYGILCGSVSWPLGQARVSLTGRKGCHNSLGEEGMSLRYAPPFTGMAEKNKSMATDEVRLSCWLGISHVNTRQPVDQSRSSIRQA